MRHLWRVERWDQFDRARQFGGVLNPARKELGGGKSCGLHSSICQGFRRRDTIRPAKLLPRVLVRARRPSHEPRPRGRAFVPALASLRPQLRLPKSLISSTRSGQSPPGVSVFRTRGRGVPSSETTPVVTVLPWRSSDNRLKTDPKCASSLSQHAHRRSSARGASYPP